VKSNQTFLGALVALVILSVVFLVIERVAARGRGRAQPIIRRGWWTDIVYWFATILLTKPLARLLVILPAAILVLAQIVPAETFKLGAYRGFGPLSRQPLWLQAIEIYLLADFIGYWTHRLFHTGKWWPFHAVHHSSEELDWLGSIRVHPVNDLVNKLAQVTPILLLGFNPVVTLSTAPVLTFYAIFLHANVNWDFGPLRSVIATPVFHRWHHSRDREAWDKNFAGLFPFWDILFGTYYMPRDHWPKNFGINEPMPAGYLGQLWEPFAWLKRGSK
jgi:sterol desaturase/sphingolipid hydroxylase (fatty acid hydroxylase superfamily)